MALGILSSESFNRELARFNIAVSAEQDKESATQIQEKELIKGRNNKSEVPSEIRKLAARESIAGASAKSISDLLGVSPSSISAYKNGATSTSTYDKPDRELQEANNQFRDKIKNLASTRLIEAIESISADKLAESKPQVASAVARDMSSVIKNISPDLQDQVNQQVIIYKPRMKDVEEYEVIDIR
jgi:predicted transcriptional regulator